MTMTRVRLQFMDNATIRDLLLLLSPADKSTTIPVANPFAIVYVLLEEISARETKLLGRTAAIAAGIASKETMIDVNFMM